MTDIDLLHPTMTTEGMVRLTTAAGILTEPHYRQRGDVVEVRRQCNAGETGARQGAEVAADRVRRHADASRWAIGDRVRHTGNLRKCRDSTHHKKACNSMRQPSKTEQQFACN